MKNIRSVKLSNTKQYPFNDSDQIVALDSLMKDKDYFVLTEVVESDGEVGEIEVTDKAINGFKIAYTGSATSATIRFCVIGE